MSLETHIKRHTSYYSKNVDLEWIKDMENFKDFWSNKINAVHSESLSIDEIIQVAEGALLAR